MKNEHNKVVHHTDKMDIKNIEINGIKINRNNNFQVSDIHTDEPVLPDRGTSYWDHTTVNTPGGQYGEGHGEV